MSKDILIPNLFLDANLNANRGLIDRTFALSLTAYNSPLEIVVSPKHEASSFSNK